MDRIGLALNCVSPILIETIPAGFDFAIVLAVCGALDQSGGHHIVDDALAPRAFGPDVPRSRSFGPSPFLREGSYMLFVLVSCQPSCRCSRRMRRLSTPQYPCRTPSSTVSQPVSRQTGPRTSWSRRTASTRGSPGRRLPLIRDDMPVALPVGLRVHAHGDEQDRHHPFRRRCSRRPGDVPLSAPEPSGTTPAIPDCRKPASFQQRN